MPLLFSIQKNEIQLQEREVKLFKHADDMALVGLILKNYKINHFVQVSKLGELCKFSLLFKTKEHIVNHIGPSLSLCDQSVQDVNSDWEYKNKCLSETISDQEMKSVKMFWK